jgi:hypothetical protein
LKNKKPEIMKNIGIATLAIPFEIRFCKNILNIDNAFSGWKNNFPSGPIILYE